MADTGIQFQALSSNFYSIPKAQILFKPSGAAAYELLGDADDVNVNIEVEETERYTNETGTRTLALTIINQVNATLNMTLTQLSNLNRALSLLGEVTYDTQTLATGAELTIEDVDHDGKLYTLGAFDVASVVVTDGAGSPVPYVLDTHYRLDAKAGIIQFVAMPDAADGDVEITFNAPAIVAGDKKTKIGIASKTENRGELIIRGTNTVGPVLMLKLNDVQLRPDGARNYISSTDLDTIQVVGRVFSDSTQSSGFELGWERVIV